MSQPTRHIKPNADDLASRGELYSEPGYWVAQAFLPMLFAGLVLHQRHRRRLAGDAAYARRRRARSAADACLRRATDAARHGDRRAFHAELQRAILCLVSDRLNLPVAGLTPGDCAQVLQREGVDSEVIEGVGAVLAACEFARFAPATASSADMAQLRSRTAELLRRLERAL